MGADATQTGLSDFFLRKYNLANRDAEYKKNRPTLGMVNRNGEALKGGDAFYVTVRVADGWSDSPDFKTGMLNYTLGKTFRWLVGDPYPQYGRLTFDGLLLQRKTLGTLIDVKGVESDGVSNNMLDSLEFQLWNDGSGIRGTISVSAGSAAARVWTLATPSDVYNLPIGTLVQAYDTTGVTLRADTYKITSFDPVAGTVSAARFTGAAGDVVVTDKLYSAGSKGLHMPGIPTFIPAVAPADTIFGVTRDGSPALSGWRFPFKSSISETIQRAFAMMGRWVNRAGGKYVCILSTTDWLLLSMEREGRVVEDTTAVQQWGLEGLRVRTPFGPITCIAIPQLADGRGYIIDWTTWTLYTLGNLPHVINDDGMVIRALQPGDPANNNFNGDGVEMRMRLWKVLLCDMPMSNATFATR